MRYGIGVDPGGTRIKTVMTDEDGSIVSSELWRIDDGRVIREIKSSKWVEIIRTGINSFASKAGATLPGLV